MALVIAALDRENSSISVDGKTGGGAVAAGAETAAELDASGLSTSVISSSTSGGRCGSSTQPSMLDSSDDSSGVEDDMIQKVRFTKN